MAVDMFMKITDINGESKGKDHEKEIDVLAWSWGMSQSGTMHQGGGGGAGKVSVQDLSFTKYFDASSATLMVACCNGKHIGEAVLTIQKAGEKVLPYIKITLTNLLIASVSTGGSGGEDRLTENVTLNFEKVKVEYDTQSETGGKGDHFDMAWDIAANVTA
jgi:type VI secretion system secreted protein Hcp